jgi:cell volume regulation protein A
VEITGENSAIGKMVVELDFPKGAQIMTIKRGNEYIIPVGSTRLQANDKLFILAEDLDTAELVYNSLD